MPALAAPPSSATQPPRRPSLIERLRLATEPETVLQVLRRHWSYPQRHGLRLVDCQVLRVHPRSSEQFVVDYALRLSGAEGESVERFFGEVVTGDAEARSEHVVARLRKPRRGQFTDQGAADRFAAIPELGLVLRPYGFDERLPGLASFYAPNTLLSLMNQNLPPSQGPVETVSGEILGHRLGKRCIVRLRGEAGPEARAGSQGVSLILKFYKSRSNKDRHVAGAMESLWARGFDGAKGPRIPRLAAHVPAWKAVLMEDIPGIPLPDLAGRDLFAGMAAAGRSLAKLHSCPLELPARHGVDEETAILELWSGLASGVRTDLGAALSHSVAEARAALDTCRDFEPALLHRDFYEKQILMKGPQAVLIDFDTLCLGDPALDLGNFIAHLRLAVLQGGTACGDLEEAFLSGYGQRDSGDFGRRRAAYTKSTLLRLACIYAFSTRWRHLSEALLCSA